MHPQVICNSVSVVFMLQVGFQYLIHVYKLYIDKSQ